MVAGGEVVAVLVAVAEKGVGVEGAKVAEPVPVGT